MDIEKLTLNEMTELSEQLKVKIKEKELENNFSKLVPLYRKCADDIVYTGKIEVPYRVTCFWDEDVWSSDIKIEANINGSFESIYCSSVLATHLFEISDANFMRIEKDEHLEKLSNELHYLVSYTLRSEDVETVLKKLKKLATK